MAIDPYRTLGLPATASLEEVKRAYRRLAKQYHPDAVGGQTSSRFLAVQAAYEAIVGGGPGAPGARGGGRAGAGAPRPWQADPARARATRESYRARGSAWGATRGRADPSESAGMGAGGKGTNAGAPGANAGVGGTGQDRPQGADPGRPGTAGRDEQASTASGPRRGRARPTSGPGEGVGEGASTGSGTSGRAGRRSSTRRKATLTSTSYDEAAREPFEPDWHGGSWYGTTSGTYWTINPKEYADPRKHGPEYQARARKAAAQGDPPAAAGPRPGSAPSTTWAGTTDDPASATASAGSAASASASAGLAATGSAEARRSDGPSDPLGPAADHASTPSGATGAGRPQPGERPPAEMRRASQWTAPAVPRSSSATAGRSPLSAGLVAGVVAAIPSGAVLVLGVMAGASPVIAVALVAPPAVAMGVALMAAVRRSAGVTDGVTDAVRTNDHDRDRPAS